jgi:ABC-type antimicrobial peptide transport system permease subunit
MVNQIAANRFWPGENPIGKSLHIGGPEGAEYEIVGVAGDAKRESLRDAAEPAVYLPFAKNTRPHFVLHVRAAGGTTPVIAALTGVLQSLAADVPPLDVTTMTAQLDRKLTLDRLMALLTLLFGALAVAVAVIGLYSVMGFAVATRTKEIGIRMSLGADSARVLGEVIREGSLLIAAGLAVGLPCALWASRFAASYLYGLGAADPVTYFALSLALAAIALAAAWLPARRAAKVDPMTALRSE